MNDEAVYRTAPATPGLLIMRQLQKEYDIGGFLRQLQTDDDFLGYL